MKCLKVIGTILFFVVMINVILWMGLKSKENPNDDQQEIDTVIEIEN